MLKDWKERVRELVGPRARRTDTNHWIISKARALQIVADHLQGGKGKPYAARPLPDRPSWFRRVTVPGFSLVWVSCKDGRYDIGIWLY